MLQPTAIVHLVRVGDNFVLSAGDTTETLFDVDTRIHTQFDLNGSNRVGVAPGIWKYLADGIAPGWHYIDLIGTTVWVRGVPVYLRGGDTVSVDLGDNHMALDGMPFFEVYQDKNIYYSFTPMFSLNCYGCNWYPEIKFDGSVMNYTAPWVAVDAGWHTIEITSPLDNVHLYYRTLFDNYTVTRFNLYPVQMN